MKPHDRHRFDPHQARGVLLIELMVALVIVAVLSTLALPAFQSLLRTWRVRTVAQELEAELFWMRGEALRRGAHIALAIESSQQCPPTGNGHVLPCQATVFVDSNGDHLRQPDEEILHKYTTPRDVSVVGTVAQSAGFDGMGNLSSLGASFVVTTTSGGRSDSSTRTLCLNRGGRMRLAVGEGC